MPIPELGVAEGQTCARLVPDGLAGCCSIYSERPEVCQTFRCLWLDGWPELLQHHRPDVVRVILTWAVAPGVLAPSGLPGVLRASVAPSGIAESGRLLLTRLAQQYCIVEIRQGAAELHGPAGLRRGMVDLLARVGAAGAGLGGLHEVSFSGGRVRWTVAP